MSHGCVILRKLLMASIHIYIYIYIYITQIGTKTVADQHVALPDGFMLRRNVIQIVLGKLSVFIEDCRSFLWVHYLKS